MGFEIYFFMEFFSFQRSSYIIKTLQTLTGLGGIITFFFYSEADFDSITEFVYATDEVYNLQMSVLNGDFKQGLEQFIDKSATRAIILGTRK